MRQDHPAADDRGLEQATEGTVRIDAADVTRTEPGKRGVAMVFQDYALFPHMNVSENITYPLKVRRVAMATYGDGGADRR